MLVRRRHRSEGCSVGAKDSRARESCSSNNGILSDAQPGHRPGEHERAPVGGPSLNAAAVNTFGERGPNGPERVPGELLDPCKGSKSEYVSIGKYCTQKWLLYSLRGRTHFWSGSGYAFRPEMERNRRRSSGGFDYRRNPSRDSEDKGRDQHLGQRPK